MENNQELLYGLAGRLLVVDLTRGTTDSIPTPTGLFRRYFGARGVGAHLLYHEMNAGTDPLGPENPLIFLNSPLSGTLAPGANKITVTFRSPLTGTYSFSLCGGHLAAELKYAGFDGIQITGRAEHPVVLWVKDGRAELVDAGLLWGMRTHQTQDEVRRRLRSPQARVAVIGPAGERGVRFAGIQSDYGREFGRGGAGALMGSKNLKAIAVRGTGPAAAALPEKLAELAESICTELRQHPKGQARRQYGTPEMVAGTNQLGFWATRNFTSSFFEDAAALTGPALKASIYAGDKSCYGCPIGCGKISPVNQGPLAGTAIEGVEFESLGLLGPNCGVGDPEVLSAAAAICDAYGFDTMSAGATVSMAMEAYERGLLSAEETGGLDLRFGSGEGLLALLEQIGERTGLGRILGEGSLRAAEALGVPELAMQVKGQELATYEPRGVVGMGLSYAISPKGGHHMIAPTMGPETAGDPARRLVPDGKAQLVRDTQLIMTVVDSLALCSSMRFVLGLDTLLEVYRAVTGADVSPEQALMAAERVVNLERLFNLREGFGRRDDSLPKRLVEEALDSGPSAGSRVPLERMLDEYYACMGWDVAGIPTAEKLEELGLSKDGLADVKRTFSRDDQDGP